MLKRSVSESIHRIHSAADRGVSSSNFRIMVSLFQLPCDARRRTALTFTAMLAAACQTCCCALKEQRRSHMWQSAFTTRPYGLDRYNAGRLKITGVIFENMSFLYRLNHFCCVLPLTPLIRTVMPSTSFIMTLDFVTASGSMKMPAWGAEPTPR